MGSNKWGEQGWGESEYGEGTIDDLNYLNRRHGADQGRIAPSGFIPGEGDFAYCFGSDLTGRIFLGKAGDHLQISQLADFDDTLILRMNTRMRPSAQMPYVCELQSPVATGDYTVTINGTAFTYSATVAPDNLDFITNQLVTLINAGAEPVTAEQGVDGIISVNADDASDDYTLTTSANIDLDQPSWRFAIYIDGGERAFHVLDPQRTRDRVDLGANTSLLAGAHTLAMRLTLVSTITSPFPVELPAAYIDPLIFVT